MKTGAMLANVLWMTGNLGAARRFKRALSEPDRAQATWLREVLVRDAESVFGREHGFGGIADYTEFARRVPLRGWEELSPWVERVRGGERHVLGMERVTHLAPTSGSSGARKLIPFTAGLQAGFSAAVGPWMYDLVRSSPGVLGGPSYWSVSPLTDEEATTGAVPVGFADDAEYLGGVQAWLVRRAMAVPAGLRHERDMEMFWRRTLVGLLGCRELRLISVWHPSFLELLLKAAERMWGDVCAELPRKRALELRAAGPSGWSRWWPSLRVISCWGEQAAEPGWRELQRKFPGVLVQPKGLLATEAVVTIPWSGAYPLAVTSHFFEFIDDTGGVRRAHEVERGKRYEVVVTNGGGLWRYRLGDVVECTGRVEATPTLRFLGRAGNVSDLRGEKLTEAFVAEVLRGLWPAGERPAHAVLRADEAGYALEISGVAKAGLVERIEAALSANPHYALARRLGQLACVRVVAVGEDAARDTLLKQRGRLGDRKPAVLVGRNGGLR
jgi:hypothetical protein